MSQYLSPYLGFKMSFVLFLLHTKPFHVSFPIFPVVFILRVWLSECEQEERVVIVDSTFDGLRAAVLSASSEPEE